MWRGILLEMPEASLWLELLHIRKGCVQFWTKTLCFAVGCEAKNGSRDLQNSQNCSKGHFANKLVFKEVEAHAEALNHRGNNNNNNDNK